MRKNYILYGHGGAYNHGCEALTKSTITLLRRIAPGCSITLSTHFAEQDRKFGLNADEFVERDMDGQTNEEIYAPTIERILKDTICIHVAGDNYCYRNWQRYAAIHHKALECGATSILWSCSIDPDAIDAQMLDVLQSHHLITARESVTYDTLIKRGLTNVLKVSDIAFTLKSEEAAFGLKDFVAINLSPLVARKNPLVLIAYQKLIDYILNRTDMSIALVPHVVQPVDNDCDALQMIDTRGSEKVKFVSGELSASQYKYIISMARFCVTARTHAAIAAYSSCIPTLAIGYNSKSQGIAVDLGMSDYVLRVERIYAESEILDAFCRLMQDEVSIKERLAEQMPYYIQSAVCEQAVQCLKGDSEE